MISAQEVVAFFSFFHPPYTVEEGKMKTTVLVHYWQKKSFLLVLKLELSFIFPFPDLFFGIHPPTLRYAKKKA